jgi:hypothetical protein
MHVHVFGHKYHHAWGKLQTRIGVVVIVRLDNECMRPEHMCISCIFVKQTLGISFGRSRKVSVVPLTHVMHT